MDPVTLSTVLLAAATGVGGALGGQLWSGVVSLVRRPLHEKPGSELPAAGAGESELAVLQQAPAGQLEAVALAEVLLARASSDPEFGRALQQWWEQAAPVREKSGNVTNTISGGTFSGPVLQGPGFHRADVRRIPCRGPARPKDLDVG